MPIAKQTPNRNTMIWPQWPAPQGVKALVTTRFGGVSHSPWDSFNLATHVGDNQKDVVRNRQIFQQWLGDDLKIQWLNQTHGTEVFEASGTNKILDADAVFSAETNQICAVLTADCLPVFFCDRLASRVAVSHAGWRGLGAGILENTLSEFSAPPEDILAWLGPAIGPKQFEVGGDVVDFYRQNYPRLHYQRIFLPLQHKPSKFLMDIYEAARQILGSQGLSHIYGGDFCTFSDAERFYSYRRDNICGRMASCIWLSHS
jgi:YfiH family protein